MRVHLADRGWPLVGDTVYRGSIRGRIADPRLHRAATSFGRQALHAWRVRFRHPRSGAAIEVQADPPPDLQALLAALAIAPRPDAATAGATDALKAPLE